MPDETPVPNTYCPIAIVPVTAETVNVVPLIAPVNEAAPPLPVSLLFALIGDFIVNLVLLIIAVSYTHLTLPTIYSV